MSQELNDQELKKLLRRTKEGNTASFGSFYKGLYNTLFIYGAHYEESKSNLEDFIQGYFLHIITHLDPFINATHLKAYLLKGFRNFIFKEKNKIRHSTDIENQSIRDSSLNPELKKCQEENRNLINRYCEQEFSSLSPKEKKLIYLRYYCELEPKAIAHVLDMNPQVVRNLLYRAIGKLRKKLSSRKDIKNLLRVALQNLNVFLW